jgi:hypothetical protein
MLVPLFPLSFHAVALTPHQKRDISNQRTSLDLNYETKENTSVLGKIMALIKLER